MSDKKRLLVFHQNCLFRDCLATYLKTSGGYDAESAEHLQSSPLIELIRDPIDVLLLDLNLPDNLTLKIARAIQQAELPTKIIVLASEDHEKIIDCIAAGVQGCVLERSPLAELDMAIARVREGETFCSPDIVSKMFTELARFAHRPHREPPKPKGRLTGREREVLELLGKRKSNKQIAAELNVSLYTVKNHVHNILEKLKVDSRVEAVKRARQQDEPGV
ncbi:response regulator transcription factor [Candidatus Laterigemmans baculatus]|uniref:response regulator transcription factor n=1 Tax=Candidatus Laterigemmans baculatus TaxID=2770505 RepID=UPI0013D99AF3|nr:response regulator transcription factor [Candidatus Laterigemmans baculatus]